MDTGQDLINELNAKSESLDGLIENLKKSGYELAKSEMIYKRTNAIFLAKALSGGEKVTVVRDMALGDNEVSLLRQQRDIHKVLYDTTREQLMCRKLQINTMREQLNQLWHSGNN